jgi:hypothetical protein
MKWLGTLTWGKYIGPAGGIEIALHQVTAPETENLGG